MKKEGKMNKQFVTYEIAILLKELGFDEEVLRWYDHQRKDKTMYVSILKKDMDKHIPAPLWQQAIDWFEEQDIIISCSGDRISNYSWTVYEINPRDSTVIDIIINDSSYTFYYDNITYETRYKAREAAILKAIELIKNRVK